LSSTRWQNNATLPPDRCLRLWRSFCHRLREKPIHLKLFPITD
jgi:hypothetical protein